MRGRTDRNERDRGREEKMCENKEGTRNRRRRETDANRQKTQ